MLKIIPGDCRRTLKDFGLEPTPGEYVANLVELFREVWRALKNDGTLWLNLGDTMTSTAPNLPDCLHACLKGCFVFGLNSVAVAASSHSVDVSADHKRTPNFVFPSFFGPEWVGVENGNDDFSEVFDFFAAPTNRGTAIPKDFMVADDAAAEGIPNRVNDGSVIFTNLDSDLKSKLAVLRSSCAGPGKENDATFPVKEANKPPTKIGIRWHTDGNSLATNALAKGFPEIDLVNNSIALRNGGLAFASLFRDFRITQASEQKITLTSIKGGLVFTISNVGHLCFVMGDGRVIPYSYIYGKANERMNRLQAKQEVGLPQMVKFALQNDGWICRQTIIWSKPNPMPESVKDRCTKAHEYIFLMTKSPRYFYNAEAIAEPAIAEPAIVGNNGSSFDAGKTGRMKKTRGGLKKGKWQDREKHSSGRRMIDNTRQARANGGPHDNPFGSTRNKRSVWTVATRPFPGAHFATFPPRLVEPCILAGSRPGDTVLDPFGGSGTVGKAALELGRKSVLCELNPEYIPLIEQRCSTTLGLGL